MNRPTVAGLGDFPLASNRAIVIAVLTRRDDASPFVARHAKALARSAPGLVLDVAGGSGRHTFLLAHYGADVVCLDRDRAALADFDTCRSVSRNHERARARYIDLVCDPWPYGQETVGGIVCVHWPFQRLLKNFIDSLRPGGLLLLETFGGHGQNVRDLPRVGAVKSALAGRFDVLDYQRRPANRNGADCETLKAFAIKH
jgi:SAM-dependent methyltransferase